jgi:RNA 3'-terminal phosphate cyclase
LFFKIFAKMKKVFMVLMATAMISLVACGGKKGESNEGKADEAAAKTEAAATTKSAVDKYISLSDEALSLAKKAQAGDISVSDRAVQIAQELADLNEELQKEVASSPEAAKKLQDYVQKFAADAAAQ